ncbi:hypothetical protein WCE01_15765, partial [Acinetobacter indicus]|uniref:hypothetical protein n=1 Tax=Acinetobacter indicus TaxID=756892 RepID=UPI0034D64D3A
MVKSNDFFRLIIVVLVGCIILFSSSATYIQIALGLTPVTICIFLSIPFLIVYLILNQLNLKLYLIDFFILLLLFWAFCSQIWTVDPDVWLNNFFWYFVCVVLFYIVR